MTKPNGRTRKTYNVQTKAGLIFQGDLDTWELSDEGHILYVDDSDGRTHHSFPLVNVLAWTVRNLND